MLELETLVAVNYSLLELPVNIPEIRTESRPRANKMKGRKLTGRQQQVLDIIREHLKVRGVPPSRPELARALGVEGQQGAVDSHLNALSKKGFVKLLPRVERGIRLLREGAPVYEPDELPEVAAGDPILAEEREPARLYDFDSFVRLFESRPDYFVRVRGDSLDRAGFRTGDIVAVRKEQEPNNGDLVVARIGQEITLKRFRRIDAECIELEPESTNPEHKTIRIDPTTEDFQIAGVVVGAIVGARNSAVTRRTPCDAD